MERVLTRRTDQIQLSTRTLSPFEGPAALAAATASLCGSAAGLWGASVFRLVVVVVPVPLSPSVSSAPSEAMPRL